MCICSFWWKVQAPSCQPPMWTVLSVHPIHIFKSYLHIFKTGQSQPHLTKWEILNETCRVEPSRTPDSQILSTVKTGWFLLLRCALVIFYATLENILIHFILRTAFTEWMLFLFFALNFLACQKLGFIMISDKHITIFCAHSASHHPFLSFFVHFCPPHSPPTLMS